MLHKSSAAVVLHCGVVIFFAFPCRERIHPFRPHRTLVCSRCCLPLEGKVSLATDEV